MSSIKAIYESIPRDPRAIVGALATALGTRGVPHCVVDIEGDQDSATTDLIVKRRDVRIVLSELHSLCCAELLLVHCREYPNRTESVMALATENYFRVFTITIASPPETNAILNERERFQGVWRARPAEEFRYLLRRLSAGSCQLGSLRDHLLALIEEIGLRDTETITAQVFGRRNTGEIFAALEQGSDHIPAHLLARPTTFERASESVRSLFAGSAANKGLFLVMLGPDGVGKSATKAALIAALSPVFQEYRGWHYRPRVFGRIGPGRPVQAPHSLKARSRWMSLAYLSAVFADCWLGYAGMARPLLARNSLVIFDRYFHDILIDPVRYRYGGPEWISKALSVVVPPKERMFLVLDADESIIFSRKKELPIEEIARQRKLYKDWASSIPGCYLVDTSGPIDEVVGFATRTVLQHLSQRLAKSYGLIPPRVMGAKPPGEGLHVVRTGAVPTAKPAETIGTIGESGQ
jgi:thymidylate kinase